MARRALRDQVDVAPFGERRSWDQPHDTGVQWSDARDIERIVVRWGKRPPDRRSVRLQYWKGQWPEKRVPKGAVAGAGSSGWLAEDDWFNGTWQRADVRLECRERTWTYTFAPLNAREFTGINDFPATYRRTLKLRLVSDRVLPAVEAIEAYTDSTWRTVEVAVEWGGNASRKREEVWDGGVELHNGRLDAIAPLRRTSAAEVRDDGWLSRVSGRTDGVRLKLRATQNADVNTLDKTVVTIRAQAHSFSFLVDDLVEGGPLYLRAFGVLISLVEHRANLRRAERTARMRGAKTLYDRVFDEQEQSLPRAWGDMPLQRSFYLVVGCEGRRQRYGVNPDGSIFRTPHLGWFRKVPGSDSERMVGEPNRLIWTFGLPQMPPSSRIPMRGYLPIMTTTWDTGGIRYEQTAFATLLDRSLDDRPIRGDDTVVGVSLVSLTATGGSAAEARLSLGVMSGPVHLAYGVPRDDGAEGLVMDGDAVRSEEGRFRALIETNRRGRLRAREGRIEYRVTLTPGRSHTVALKLSYFPLTDDEIDRLRAIDGAQALAAVAQYWERRIAQSTQITTPEPMINDFYRAHAAHLLVNHERHPASDRERRALDVACVGSFVYGAFANESVMQISDLDRRGYHQEAERGYELFVHYQGTVMLPGDFSAKAGIYYGAGGYECGNYNQHHGWVLWGIGEHYFTTRDRAWLRRVAPSIVRGCDWIASERRRTMTVGADGRRDVAHGFLPAGVLEDIQDWWHWLSTNAYAWWGFDRAASALADAALPEASRLLEEARKFREDLVAGFTEAMVRSAIVRLSDGTAVPHVPSHQHLRGRSYGWIRETLEGAIHLVRTGVFPAESELGTWIMKDYEDNLYLSDRFGYHGLSVPDRERHWFSRGGFSMQPNLLCGPLPYLFRDETKHFVRAYFNSFAAGFHADTRMMTEHPLPQLGDWAGDHYKTSDEANSAYWLRLMFIYERGDDLLLGFGVPRYWLRDGETLSVQRAQTYFGEMSLVVRSEVARRRITVEIDPPRRNPPARTLLRIRHPEEEPLLSVTVNGERWPDFDTKSEAIGLPGLAGPTTVVARYRR